MENVDEGEEGTLLEREKCQKAEEEQAHLVRAYFTGDDREREDRSSDYH